ncbi:hypothetical protein J2X09_003267 [Hydrogenophaga laconesensis]|uniref:Uncharacterized protein n=1 Tax=Hydrogenophaga laconesensis TaxID=1805971 RepID=A0ABU1VDF8_9BURK|nr:hypothetical protein [Hydrogenophaga laconesensis]
MEWVHWSNAMETDFYGIYVVVGVLGAVWLFLAP